MKTRSSLIAALLFVLGVAVGFAARKGVDPATYRGKSNKEAAKALLKLAETQAGKGSWERIAVGRIYYLGGMKAEGQALFTVGGFTVHAGAWIILVVVPLFAGYDARLLRNQRRSGSQVR
jgi:hypothetical protein